LPLYLYNVLLQELAGREIAEIAETLGIDESTVRTYRSQYRAILKASQEQTRPAETCAKRK